MMPDDTRRLLSRYIDGDLGSDETETVERLLGESSTAREYLVQLEALRRRFRYEPAGSPPDVVQVVLDTVASSRPRISAPRAAAVFVAAAIAGAVFVGLTVDGPGPVASADIPDRVLEAQAVVVALDAELTILERGWHEDVAERTYLGEVSYRSPETLTLQVRDTTAYPSDKWTSNDVTTVVAEDVAWVEGIPGCPSWALPDCLLDTPRGRVTVGREPFADGSEHLLDLIVPVGGFSRASQPEVIGMDEISGRDAVGVRVTVAQMAPLIGVLTQGGNWRSFHPTDIVELWLDSELLVPLAMTIAPAVSDERRLWAVREGYADPLGQTVLEVRWHDVSTSEVPIVFPDRDSGLALIDAGFTDVDVAIPFGVDLPEGMERHRSGKLVSGGPMVEVATWSDGRAWIKVAWTYEWSSKRLFGGLGDLVRSTAVGGGVGYLNERGDRVALHTSDVDVLVTGSLETDQLIGVAASLGVQGLGVPGTWAEADSATLAEAREAVPDLLTPSDLEGFGVPNFKLVDGVVLQRFAGPGNRGFILAQAPGSSLTPPLEESVSGVVVRGTIARFSPDRGLLEWSEGQHVVSLESSTLSLSELVAIAEALST